MEARLTIEGQLLGLSNSEFRKELEVSEREFQKDILKRVYLLKLRDQQICNSVITENNENTQTKADELKRKMEELKFERDQNQAIALRNFQKSEKHSQLWYKKRILHKYYEHFKNNWQAK
mmetsp:Transcript_2104/g.2385  ORF Transcript_2104/g.2385 Transcript_2104/m.2385 type:complete len:120 (+) Transcript_2104:12-371(+)